jgi:hypothetical protein
LGGGLSLLSPFFPLLFEIYFRSDDERDVVPPFKFFLLAQGEKKKVVLSILVLFTAAPLATNLSK